MAPVLQKCSLLRHFCHSFKRLLMSSRTVPWHWSRALRDSSASLEHSLASPFSSVRTTGTLDASPVRTHPRADQKCPRQAAHAQRGAPRIADAEAIASGQCAHGAERVCARHWRRCLWQFEGEFSDSHPQWCGECYGCTCGAGHSSQRIGRDAC